MKLLRIKLDDSLHARLKVQCAINKSSMQRVGVHLLKTWVDECETWAHDHEGKKQAAIERAV